MAELTAFVTAGAVPLVAPVDPPEVEVVRADTQVVVQAFAPMVDQGNGMWTFAFAIPDPLVAYSFLVDADPLVTGQVSVSERFQGGSLPGDADASIIDVLYMNGVWIDTVGGGAPGVILGTNGTERNPSSNITDATAIAAALGIRRFKLRGPVTLLADFPRAIWTAVAGGGTIDPGGFDVGGGIFVDVGLTGNIGTGTGAIFGFQTSLLGPTSGFVGVLVRPGLTGTITLGAGITTIAQGASLVPGVATPIIDLAGVASLNLRAYSGGVDMRGSSAGGQNTSLEFTAGQVIVGHASNTAGVFAIRGWPDIIGLPGNGVTINLDGLGSVLVDDELTANHGAGAWNETAVLASIASLRDFLEGGRDIDFVGDDVLGWQRIERTVAGVLVRRYNLFDEGGARITGTVAAFIAAGKMISAEVAI